MSARVEPLTSSLPDQRVPGGMEQVGEALLGGSMALGVCAVALTLFAAAPAFRPGGGGATPRVTRVALAGPLVAITLAALTSFIAYIGYAERCGDACIERGGPALAGRAVWWRTEMAWQWAGQLALASIALAAAALALTLAARGMRGVRPSLMVARGTIAVWLIVALAIPLAIELAAA